MNNWLKETILNGIQELEAEKSAPGWFSVSAISNVPYIKYPFLSDIQNQEIQTQAKQVLILSRTQNQYKETAITYSIDDDISPGKYIKVLGDYNSVQLMDDVDTKNLIIEQNKKGNLVVVSLHNHPNDSGFSATDILVFANNPSIRIMEVVNTKGEVSILARPIALDLKKEMLSLLELNIPDIADRVNRWKKDEMSLIDITTVEERNNIVANCLDVFTSLGIFYSDYVDIKKAQDLSFTTIKIFPSNKDDTLLINKMDALSGSTVHSGEAIFSKGEDYER